MPTKYEFSPKLETGNPIIDNEHRLIISAVNDTLDAIEQGVSKTQVLDEIKIFARYVNTHFPHEEALQEKYQYPNIRFHRLWHKSYVKDIDLTCDRILTEGISSLTIAELKRRIETLVQHILLEDSKVAEHIKTQGNSK